MGRLYRRRDNFARTKKGEVTSPLLDLNRAKRTFFDAHQTAATQFTVNVRQFVRFKLHERFQLARLARDTLATHLAFVCINLRRAIIVPDHAAPSLVVGRQLLRHASIPPAKPYTVRNPARLRRRYAGMLRCPDKQIAITGLPGSSPNSANRCGKE